MAIKRPFAGLSLVCNEKQSLVTKQITKCCHWRNEEKLITNSNYSRKACNHKGLRVVCNYVIKNNQ